MSRRLKLELKMLMMVLGIINKFFCKYSLRISQVNPKIKDGDIRKIRAIDQIELLDNMDKYWSLSLADFLIIHRALQDDPRCLNHLDHNIVFASERVYRSDERNRKNPTIHLICLERAKENGPWLTKVLPKEFLDANRDKYKTACISR